MCCCCFCCIWHNQVFFIFYGKKNEERNFCFIARATTFFHVTYIKNMREGGKLNFFLVFFSFRIVKVYEKLFWRLFSSIKLYFSSLLHTWNIALFARLKTSWAGRKCFLFFLLFFSFSCSLLWFQRTNPITFVSAEFFRKIIQVSKNFLIEICIFFKRISLLDSLSIKIEILCYYFFLLT